MKNHHSFDSILKSNWETGVIIAFAFPFPFLVPSLLVFWRTLVSCVCPIYLTCYLFQMPAHYKSRASQMESFLQLQWFGAIFLYTSKRNCWFKTCLGFSACPSCRWLEQVPSLRPQQQWPHPLPPGPVRCSLHGIKRWKITWTGLGLYSVCVVGAVRNWPNYNDFPQPPASDSCLSNVVAVICTGFVIHNDTHLQRENLTEEELLNEGWLLRY